MTLRKRCSPCLNHAVHRIGPLLIAALTLAGCEARPADDRVDAESARTEPAAIPSTSPAEPTADAEAPTDTTPTAGAEPTAPSPALGVTISGIDSPVTTTRLPNHMRFSLVNAGDKARDIELRSIVLRGADGTSRELAIQEQQLWPTGADTPTAVTPDHALSLAAGVEALLLVYLDSWDGDPLAERYEFEGRFTQDGSPQVVPVTIQRARREPRRR